MPSRLPPLDILRIRTVMATSQGTRGTDEMAGGISSGTEMIGRGVTRIDQDDIGVKAGGRRETCGEISANGTGDDEGLFANLMHFMDTYNSVTTS